MQKNTDKNAIYNTLLKKKENGVKSLSILIDPDKIKSQEGIKLLDFCKNHAPDFFMVGGSLITNQQLEYVIQAIKSHPNTAHIPVVLFPNSYLHLSAIADGILFLSLISGRNPEYLIGNHVIAAPILKQTQLEIIPTGYVLVNCGNQTTVQYISNTMPIPYEKNDIAVCTALAGEMLGLKMLYIDGGSGAKQAISKEMISAVKQNIDIPLIIGGGIRTIEAMRNAFEAGADTVVIGSAVEQEPTQIEAFCKELRNFNKG